MPEAIINERLKEAEQALIRKGIQVTRHCSNNQVFQLSVFGELQYEMWKIEKIIGKDYSITLFPNEQEIVIN